jgi:sugar phosphate isomerase/epimerase
MNVTTRKTIGIFCAVFIFITLLNPIALVAADEVRTQFFAFDNGVGRDAKWTPEEQAKTLKELGYDGIGYTGIGNLTERLNAFNSEGLQVFSLYLACHPDKEVPYPPQLKEAIKQIEGTGTMIWLTVFGETNDEDAARVIQEIADVAEPHGVRIAIYPHYGIYIATARDAVRLVKKVDRANVGVSINLCHELRSGNADQLEVIVKEAAPYLFLASINGADRQGKWDQLIRTLDQGEFDVSLFLKQLNDAGYRGPIGLQSYNIKGDQLANLETSMQAWKALSSSLE